MKKILIVEDNINIHNVLEELLINANYATYNAYSGTEALLLLEKEKYDLILLDLMLPGVCGEELIEKINDTPIIVLSAKISSEDKVNCLQSGANDYIIKPFDSKELLARIEVQLRSKIKSSITETLKYKDLELLNDNHTLLICGHKVNLTKTEYTILKHLLLNPSQVVTKTKLLDLISIDFGDCDESSLKVHISNIRKKIKRVTNENYIESVWGIGFKMYD
ncbi:MAG: response regulator transcription factor [Bacilli bacterium]|nr:response regulator transcription factor [Bacilli bacterium]